MPVPEDRSVIRLPLKLRQHIGMCRVNPLYMCRNSRLFEIFAQIFCHCSLVIPSIDTPNGQKLFYETVHDLKSKYHMAIVLITHEIEALEHICDQAVLLNKKVLAIGKPEEVREEAVNQKQLYVGGRIR